MPQVPPASVFARASAFALCVRGYFCAHHRRTLAGGVGVVGEHFDHRRAAVLVRLDVHGHVDEVNERVGDDRAHAGVTHRAHLVRLEFGSTGAMPWSVVMTNSVSSKRPRCSSVCSTCPTRRSVSSSETRWPSE